MASVSGGAARKSAAQVIARAGDHCSAHVSVIAKFQMLHQRRHRSILCQRQSEYTLRVRFFIGTADVMDLSCWSSV